LVSRVVTAALSLGAEGTDAAETIVSVQTDGSVIVSSGITDMGQGAQTQMSQITAEVLGISMDRIPISEYGIRVVLRIREQPSHRAEQLWAAQRRRMRQKKYRATLLEVGAEMTGNAVNDLDLLDNYLMNKKTKERLASFSELTTTCFNKGKPMIGLGWHHSPKTSWDEKQGTGDAYFTFVYGANVAEVEVDIGNRKK